MSRRKSIFTTLLLVMMLMCPMTAYATSLDDLVAGQETTAAQSEEKSTVNGAGETTAAAETQEQTEAYVDEPLSENDNSFAKQLANTANLSRASASTSKFSKMVNKWCTVIFQYLTSLACGAYLVTIAIDMIYILVAPARAFLSNGYVGNATADSPMNNGVNGVSGAAGGYAAGGYAAGGYNRGYNRGAAIGNQMQQQDMATTRQNQPALGRLQLVSNEALNLVAKQSSSQSQINPLVAYFKEVAIKATMSTFILILSASGVLAKLGAFLAIKAIGAINQGLAGAL